METIYIQTPLGSCLIEGDDNGIAVVSILDKTVPTTEKIPAVLQPAAQQLEEYFKGDRQDFNLKLNPQGTPFQQKVWKILLNIPYGTTTTYAKQALALGDIKAIRAMASANGKNPLWVIIPCHRVIGTDGSLTGYAGGIHRKKWLLAHENNCEQLQLF